LVRYDAAYFQPFEIFVTESSHIQHEATIHPDETE
jgi:hypothetical protein